MLLLYVMLAIYLVCNDQVMVTSSMVMELKRDDLTMIGTTYTRTSAKINTESIISSFIETSLTACVLSCRSSTRCFNVAVRTSDTQQECLHLSDISAVNTSDAGEEVELMNDTSIKRRGII